MYNKSRKSEKSNPTVFDSSPEHFRIPFIPDNSPHFMNPTFCDSPNTTYIEVRLKSILKTPNKVGRIRVKTPSEYNSVKFSNSNEDKTPENGRRRKSITSSILKMMNRNRKDPENRMKRKSSIRFNEFVEVKHINKLESEKIRKETRDRKRKEKAEKRKNHNDNDFETVEISEERGKKRKNSNKENVSKRMRDIEKVRKEKEKKAEAEKRRKKFSISLLSIKKNIFVQILIISVFLFAILTILVPSIFAFYLEKTGVSFSYVLIGDFTSLGIFFVAFLLYASKSQITAICMKILEKKKKKIQLKNFIEYNSNIGKTHSLCFPQENPKEYEKLNKFSFPLTGSSSPTECSFSPSSPPDCGEKEIEENCDENNTKEVVVIEEKEKSPKKLEKKVSFVRIRKPFNRCNTMSCIDLNRRNKSLSGGNRRINMKLMRGDEDDDDCEDDDDVEEIFTVPRRRITLKKFGNLQNIDNPSAVNSPLKRMKSPLKRMKSPLKRMKSPLKKMRRKKKNKKKSVIVPCVKSCNKNDASARRRKRLFSDSYIHSPERRRLKRRFSNTTLIRSPGSNKKYQIVRIPRVVSAKILNKEITHRNSVDYSAKKNSLSREGADEVAKELERDFEERDIGIKKLQNSRKIKLCGVLSILFDFSLAFIWLLNHLWVFVSLAFVVNTIAHFKIIPITIAVNILFFIEILVITCFEIVVVVMYVKHRMYGDD